MQPTRPKRELAEQAEQTCLLSASLDLLIETMIG